MNFLFGNVLGHSENPYQKVNWSMRSSRKPSYEFGPFRLDAAEVGQNSQRRRWL